MNKRQLMIMILIAGGCLLFITTVMAGPAPKVWVAPSSSDTLKNPKAADSDSWKAGAALYNTACVVCHGNRGAGDGIAGAALSPRPADLTTKEMQDQSDGAIFWKLTEGKPPMAGYKSIYSDQQRWELVEFIRTLKKK